MVASVTVAHSRLHDQHDLGPFVTIDLNSLRGGRQDDWKPR
jgi:hypothetical protein